MVPKIIVSHSLERQVVYEKILISEKMTLGFDGLGAKVIELRSWINFATNIAVSSPEISLVIWDADRLSQECQGVLLKPLEDLTETTNLFLIVTNENGLLPTILSRCLLENIFDEKLTKSEYWLDIKDCFVKGPDKCLSLAEKLEKNEMENALEELIFKLKDGLNKEVSKNRLAVIKKAIDCLAIIRDTNVNAKLAFGNFLISSWRMVRAPAKS